MLSRTAASAASAPVDAWLCSKSRSQQFSIIPISSATAARTVKALFAALADPYVTEWKSASALFTAYTDEAAMTRALLPTAVPTAVVVVDAATEEVVGGAAIRGDTFDFFVVSAFRAEGQTIAILQMACLWLAANPVLAGRKPLVWEADAGDLPMLRLMQKIERTCGDRGFTLNPTSIATSSVATVISHPTAFVVALASAVTVDAKKRRVVRMHPGGPSSQFPSAFDAIIETAKAGWAPKRKQSSFSASDCSEKDTLPAAGPIHRHNPYAASIFQCVSLRKGDAVWVSNCQSGWDSCAWMWADTDAIVLDRQGPYCYLSTPEDFPFLHLAVTLHHGDEL